VAGPSFIRVALPQGSILKSIAGAGRDVTNTPVEFMGNERLMITLDERSPSITGRVIDRSGVPTAATVVLFATDRNLWHRHATTTRVAPTDGNGSFTLAPVPGGTYFIIATPSRLAGVNPAMFDVWSTSAREIRVTADGAEGGTLTLTLAQ
jgi:hypothetical protein